MNTVLVIRHTTDLKQLNCITVYSNCNRLKYANYDDQITQPLFVLQDPYCYKTVHLENKCRVFVNIVEFLISQGMWATEDGVIGWCK